MNEEKKLTNHGKQRSILRSMVYVCNIAYLIFLCIKTSLSYRSGIASLSQDLADHKALQVIAVALLTLFSSTFSYVQGIRATQRLEAYEGEMTALFLMYEWFPTFSQFLWAGQFIALFVVIIYPIDIYEHEHYLAAGFALILVYLYQVWEFSKRVCLFYTVETNEHLEENRKTIWGMSNQINKNYPLPAVSFRQVLGVNFLFLVLLLLFFIHFSSLPSNDGFGVRRCCRKNCFLFFWCLSLWDLILHFPEFSALSTVLFLVISLCRPLSSIP